MHDGIFRWYNNQLKIMSLFGPRMWPKWVVFCLNFANWLGSKFGKRGAYHCANVGYLHETETMRYQGNPAVEQRKADAWVDGRAYMQCMCRGYWECTMRSFTSQTGNNIRRINTKISDAFTTKQKGVPGNLWTMCLDKTSGKTASWRWVCQVFFFFFFFFPDRRFLEFVNW